jgi:hypothetical protein
VIDLNDKELIKVVRELKVLKMAEQLLEITEYPDINNVSVVTIYVSHQH